MLGYTPGRIQSPEAHVRTVTNKMCEMLTHQQHRRWREARWQGEAGQGSLGPEEINPEICLVL